MKIYIAGKITGDPDYRGKFKQAEEALKAAGYTVLNPARLPEGMAPEDYMRICFAMIDVADFVAMLPGWTESSGARVEHEYCQYIEKSTYSLSYILNLADLAKKYGEPARQAEKGEGNA